MNKRIYLILEIKKRELDSRCYFAIKSCLNGFETVISKKNIFYKNKSLFKTGMVLLKSLGINYYKEIVDIKKCGHYVSVMDEEGLMYFSKEDFIQRRIYKENLKKIDYIFTWGENDYNMLSGSLPKFKNKIFKTGSSRIDILKKPINQIYQKEAKIIKEKYGDFFLLNTFFTYTNHFFGSWIKKRKEVLQSEGFDEKSLVYSNGLRMEKLQKETLKSTIDFIEKFSKKFPNAKLIIRPHMSENHDLWKKISKKYANVLTIYDDLNACSWIMASNFSISSNCTTSVEAFLLKKLNFNFEPFEDNNVLYQLPKMTGIKVKSTEELLKKIENFEKLGLENENFRSLMDKNFDKLKANMLNLDMHTCSVENMINYFSKELNKKSKVDIDLNTGRLSFYYSKIKAKINFYIIFIKSLISNDVKNKIKFAKQKFPDLTKKEVENKILMIAESMNIKKKFNVKEIYPGSFLIKVKND
jgi:surface carbohydrate biosynthesis protein